jgi:hypothetical protein
MEQQFKSQAKQQQAAASVKAMIDDARQWPGFTEHESDILQTLKSNPKISLDAAYRQVVMPKMQADRNKVREEVLAELKTRPTTTSIPATTPVTPSNKPRSTSDIAREIMNRTSR